MMRKRVKALQNGNRRLPILALLLFCTACSTFPLSGKIYAPADKTSEQENADILTCKARAKDAADSQDEVPAILGMTLIGAYVTNEIVKPKQREVFKNCMERFGYSVTPPNDDAPGKDDITS